MDMLSRLPATPDIAALAPIQMFVPPVMPVVVAKLPMHTSLPPAVTAPLPIQTTADAEADVATVFVPITTFPVLVFPEQLALFPMTTQLFPPAFARFPIATLPEAPVGSTKAPVP